MTFIIHFQGSVMHQQELWATNQESRNFLFLSSEQLWGMRQVTPSLWDTLGFDSISSKVPFRADMRSSE